VLEARDTLLAVIAPALRLQKFIQRGPAIARSLRVSRPNRPMQMSRLENIFKNR
jgi:hypothetical protein